LCSWIEYFKLLEVLAGLLSEPPPPPQAVKKRRIDKIKKFYTKYNEVP